MSSTRHTHRRSLGQLQAPEVRWFLPGTAEHAPEGEQYRRTDSYHLGSLQESISWKIRGRRGPLEKKVRVAALPVVVGGVPVMAEQWAKSRQSRRSVADLGDDWIVVHKEVWRSSGLELARVTIEDQRWWSIALRMDRFDNARRALALWSGRLRDEGVAASYPQWLLRVARPMVTTDRTGRGS